MFIGRTYQEPADCPEHVWASIGATVIDETVHRVWECERCTAWTNEPHSVVADEQSVVLVSNTPAGFDEFVTAAGEPTDDETVPTPPPSDDAIQRVRAVTPEHGIEIVGPPPGHQ